MTLPEIDVHRVGIDAFAQAREYRPRNRDELWEWVSAYLGVQVEKHAVCRGHSSPLDMLSHQFFERPPLSLWHGPRGGGKSFVSAIDSHLTSRFNPRHGTRILGGSYAQSRQIYKAIKSVVKDYGEDSDSIARLLDAEARYANGSTVAILAASETAVRGPHDPTLKLDEVDEIPRDLRESAMGMAMEMNGYQSSILMTSTWHRSGGPMADLMALGLAGAFPVHSFCIFEVLQTCPAERSGEWVGGEAGYEHCPPCPIQPFCHAERDDKAGILPKAKRSSGHYGIRTFIDKARNISRRVFKSDYLCEGPSVEGTVFPEFDKSAHVTERAEFNPGLPVHLSIDSGVRTGAVWFQIVRNADGQTTWDSINVFADYFSEGKPAKTSAKEIVATGETRCKGYRHFSTTDPAGASRTSIGSTVMAEYERGGLTGLTGWPSTLVLDGLALIDSFLRSGDGTTSLQIHPRCVHLISAFENYRRKKISGAWTDDPADPQHPHEDLMDALRGGLYAAYPEGRRPEKKRTLISPRRVF